MAKKSKINLQLLLDHKSFYWGTRYSEDDNTDDCGRWARIGYFNGFCVAWITGIFKGDSDIIENGRCGKVDVFSVTLYFPVSSQPMSGHEVFKTIEEAKEYVQDMFYDFRKRINKK